MTISYSLLGLGRDYDSVLRTKCYLVISTSLVREERMTALGEG